MAADETAADRKRPRVADDAALPRDTKIRVVGNGRTKDSLIGTEAVVIKAIGLGGWHWLVRGALRVRPNRKPTAPRKPRLGKLTATENAPTLHLKPGTRNWRDDAAAAQRADSHKLSGEGSIRRRE